MERRKKRKNINMTPELAKWYEDRAESMGLSHSALMVIALQEFASKERKKDHPGQIEMKASRASKG